jgi:hypothetical protein
MGKSKKMSGKEVLNQARKSPSPFVSRDAMLFDESEPERDSDDALDEFESLEKSKTNITNMNLEEQFKPLKSTKLKEMNRDIPAGYEDSVNPMRMEDPALMKKRIPELKRISLSNKRDSLEFGQGSSKTTSFSNPESVAVASLPVSKTKISDNAKEFVPPKRKSLPKQTTGLPVPKFSQPLSQDFIRPSLKRQSDGIGSSSKRTKASSKIQLTIDIPMSDVSTKLYERLQRRLSSSSNASSRAPSPIMTPKPAIPSPVPTKPFQSYFSKIPVRGTKLPMPKPLLSSHLKKQNESKF